MRRYIIRRILEVIPTTAGVLLLTFALFHVVGGSPAEVVLGKNATPEGLALFDAKYGYLGEYDFTHIHQDETAIAGNALEVLSAMLDGKNMRRQTRLIPARFMEGPTT